MRTKHYGELIRQIYFQEDPKVSCPTVTFQVTDDCCLNCSYCYQINKGHRMMSKDTIKQGIDLLFKMYDENKEDAFINHHTHGLIIEFIGGEPLMNMPVITYGSKYFLDECIKRDHPWLTNFRFNFSTNGQLYFNKEVQDYLYLFGGLSTINITIDGPKELHDSCRKDFEGNGSFDQAIAAFKDWVNRGNVATTKITIAPENLPYLNKILDFFAELGCTEIYANPIFEREWTIEDAQLYYKQLKLIADKLLLYENIEFSPFGELIGLPLSTSHNENWCGGTGNMLSFDPDGIAYPCIRYMESSLGTNRAPLQIGDVTGIYIKEEHKKIMQQFSTITRRSQSTDECYYCPVAGGCSWCSAWNYQKYGTYNKRDTNICWMHRARTLANSYYQNKLFILNGEKRRFPVYLPRDIAIQIISAEEYNELIGLATNIER